MQLKPFQIRTLKTLGDFLQRSRITGNIAAAFSTFAPSERGTRRPYFAVAGLGDVPYVCIRIPTGGGKTIVGAHAIPVIKENFVYRDLPFVIWLVTSEPIREQTARALKDRSHPYRIALDESLNGKVEIYDTDEIDRMRPADLRSKIGVMVATIQTFRVEDRTIRNAYADRESLETFFSGVDPAGLDLKPGTTRPLYSFGNLMRLCAPILIVDEAHNVRTAQSFATLASFGPSCILELSATPESRHTGGRIPSNILVSVDTGELKEAEMVKLPILLSVEPRGWKEALFNALAKQRELLSLAGGEDEYVRPLMLIQAQNTGSEAGVEEVKAFLLESGVAESAIKIATGEQRELADIDLFSRDTQVDAVITKEALREGWDCSFAYVFCSLRNVMGATAVEQLLGRVLRMPYASRRRVPELNEAYAFVVSEDFAATAAALRDKIVSGLGFTAAEADSILREAPAPGPGLFARVIDVVRRPRMADLSETETRAVRVFQSPSGQYTVELRDEVTEPLAERILAEVQPDRRDAERNRIAIHNIEVKRQNDAGVRPLPFSVPQLYVTVDGQQELFTTSSASDDVRLALQDVKPDLASFIYAPLDRKFEIDYLAGRMEVLAVRVASSLLPFSLPEMTQRALVNALHDDVHSRAFTHTELDAWLNGQLTAMQEQLKIPLEVLYSSRFALASFFREQITLAQESAEKRGYQQLLMDSFVPQVEERPFIFDPSAYNPISLYKGSFSFPKHISRLIGDMNDPEAECASVMDSAPEVKAWVRNVERDQLNSFKLPTLTDYFYPDFVAQLVDGRVLVVEYKGERTNEDDKEKRELGLLWQDRSRGKGVFAWIVSSAQAGKRIDQQIQAHLR